jgi:hypothetical protein
MAGGGYRGILAAVPTAQNLRSAFRRGKKIKSKSEAAYGPAYPSSPLPQIIGGAPPIPCPAKFQLWERACSRRRTRIHL